MKGKSINLELSHYEPSSWLVQDLILDAPDIHRDYQNDENKTTFLDLP